MATNRLLGDALPRFLCGYPVAAVVLAAHFVLTVSSVREKSNTFDEIAHITAGFSYWTNNDYRLQPENGNLAQRWFALPLLTMGLEFPRDQALWAASDVWKIGRQFFFEVGNDLDALLQRARCMNAILSVGLGLLVYAWSRQLFGPAGGMLSLLVYATDPTVLANGSLATSDLAAAAFFTVAVGCLWKLFHTVSPGSIFLAWVALAGLFLSKMSALLIVPMGLALLALRFMGRRSLKVACRKEITIHGWPGQAGILFGLMLLQVVLVAATIWAFYGFRYSAFREPHTGEDQFYVQWHEVLDDTGVFGRVIVFARDNHLLPEAYLFGTAFSYKCAQARDAFLNGHYSTTGWWYFFPYTFLVKTPLPTFFLLLFAGAGAIWSWRQAQPGRRQAMGAVVWRGFCATAPLWVLLGVYWCAAIGSKLNIGHRHILPTYPATFILAGAVAYWFYQRGWLGWMASSAVLACVATLAVECSIIYPHFLAYFNLIAGGPSNGYKHLAGSSLDWGQDLPGLKGWLKQQRLDGQSETPVYLAYAGTASPAYYQIHAIDVCAQPTPLQEGVYCIGATCLARGPWSAEYEKTYRAANRAVALAKTTDPAGRNQGIRSLEGASWSKTTELLHNLRLLRLCAYLRQRPPDDNVGYSILIYWLTAQDIRNALFGPPVSLDRTWGPVDDFDQAGQPDAEPFGK